MNTMQRYAKCALHEAKLSMGRQGGYGYAFLSACSGSV